MNNNLNNKIVTDPKILNEMINKKKGDSNDKKKKKNDMKIFIKNKKSK